MVMRTNNKESRTVQLINWDIILRHDQTEGIMDDTS